MDQQNEQAQKDEQIEDQVQPQELDPNEVRFESLTGIPAIVAGLGKNLSKEEFGQPS